MSKLLHLYLYLLLLLAASGLSHAHQALNLEMFHKSRRWELSDSWPQLEEVITGKEEGNIFPPPVFVDSQEGLMEADNINALPGQPQGVDFDQYSGYVTVDPKAGRALFYYFVESPTNSSSKPLLLWLNGGPGCSSIGYGAMTELGPFRVNSDNKTLFINKHAWNEVANVIFLESPAGVGFSYSNTSSDYGRSGDKQTARDAYAFLVNWLERFPHYKNRDFYIAGESYAGHYVPQLAYTITVHNKKNHQNQRTIINLKGIAIGNGLLDDLTDAVGFFNYIWTHAMNSDETYKGIIKHCDLLHDTEPSKLCISLLYKSFDEMGKIDSYNIYAPLCQNPNPKSGISASAKEFDPCSDVYTESYLNSPEVQKAFHAKHTTWSGCSLSNWTDSPITVLPIIKTLMANGIRVWIYSGDIDSVIPVTATKYAINKLKLSVEKPWHAWYTNNEVAGYVESYQEGMTFVTVKGAGHLVPSNQPARALTLISSFLQGILPPSLLV